MERVQSIALVKIIEGNNPGIVDSCLKEPLLADNHLLWEQILLFCVSNDIVGEKFRKFISICCGNKKAKVLITKCAIDAGFCNKKLLEENLSLEKPVPFVEETKPLFVSSKEGNKINPQQRALFFARYSQEKRMEIR